MNVPAIHNIVFLDIAVIIIFVVLAYLSKRLGEALKKPPFYKLFYIGGLLIIGAVLINAISANDIIIIVPGFSDIFTMGMRFFSVILAVFACMQYWKWLFSEIFKKK